MILHWLERARKEAEFIVGRLVNLHSFAVVFDLGVHTVCTPLEGELDTATRFRLKVGAGWRPVLLKTRPTNIGSTG